MQFGRLVRKVGPRSGPTAALFGRLASRADAAKAEGIVGQRPRSPLSSRSAWHRQPVRKLPPARKGRAVVGRLRPAHRVGVVAVHRTHPQRVPRT